MSTNTPALEATTEADEFQTGRILTIVGGHFVHDTFSAFVSPLLPLLIEKLSLTLTLGGSLSIFMQLPSLLSVLIGYVADRVSVRYLVIFASAVTATLSDRIGRKQTIIVATVASSLFMLIFLNVEGVLMLVMLALLGVTSLSVTPVLQAIVQEQLPGIRATASGMFILYAFIIQAINTFLIGVIGDHAGLNTAFAVSIGIALLSIPIVLLLPAAPIEPSGV